MICQHVPPPLRWMPESFQRYILHFEAAIEHAVRSFSAGLPDGSRVLDAGAGEGQYAQLFSRHRYVGVDLGIGDQSWSYSRLEAIADLSALPFAEGSFDACLNIVTLEHVRDPARVVSEMARVLRPGGSLLLATPLEWEEHQQPHDFFRYTRYGIGHLLESCGLGLTTIEPVGGYFRLLARRLQNGVQFFPGAAALLAGLVLGPPSLVLPLLDGLDTRRNFTLGHICLARKD